MSATQTKIPAGTWNLDPVHSTASFEVAYLAGTFRGTFRDMQAEVDISDGRTRIEGTANVASVDVKLESQTIEASGEITIKGIAKPIEVAGTISAPITDAWGNERIGLQLSATVDRTEFGLDWNMPLPTGDQALANPVTILAELQLVKAA
jgi:polyisoprenoid-binding protein YceI